MEQWWAARSDGKKRPQTTEDAQTRSAFGLEPTSRTVTRPPFRDSLFLFHPPRPDLRRREAGRGGAPLSLSPLSLSLPWRRCRRRAGAAAAQNESLCARALSSLSRHHPQLEHFKPRDTHTTTTKRLNDAAAQPRAERRQRGRETQDSQLSTLWLLFHPGPYPLTRAHPALRSLLPLPEEAPGRRRWAGGRGRERASERERQVSLSLLQTNPPTSLSRAPLPRATHPFNPPAARDRYTTTTPTGHPPHP